MKNGILFSSKALKIFCWAVIPFLVLGCSTAKTVKNNAHSRADTLIIYKTDTVRQVQWRLRTDTIRQVMRVRDSTVQRQQGDTVIREIWHWRESESRESKREMDSLTERLKTLTARMEVSMQEDTEESKSTTDKSERLKMKIFALLGALMVCVIGWERLKR